MKDKEIYTQFLQFLRFEYETFLLNDLTEVVLIKEKSNYDKRLTTSFETLFLGAHFDKDGSLLKTFIDGQKNSSKHSQDISYLLANKKK